MRSKSVCTAKRTRRPIARCCETLDAHLFEIKHALGEHVEAEQWTKSWTRVHELMPYDKLDDATAARVLR